MTKLAQRPGAEAAPVAIKFTDPYRPPVRAYMAAPRWFEVFDPTANASVAATPKESAEPAESGITGEGFPAWSSLSWDERADYIARYCR